MLPTEDPHRIDAYIHLLAGIYTLDFITRLIYRMPDKAPIPEPFRKAIRARCHRLIQSTEQGHVMNNNILHETGERWQLDALIPNRHRKLLWTQVVSILRPPLHRCRSYVAQLRAVALYSLV